MGAGGSRAQRRAGTAEYQAPLPGDQQTLLAKLYLSIGVPLDQLLDESAEAEQLTKRFYKASHAHLSSALLLRELLQLRKGGKLPSIPPRNLPKRRPRARTVSPVTAGATRV